MGQRGTCIVGRIIGIRASPISPHGVVNIFGVDLTNFSLIEGNGRVPLLILLTKEVVRAWEKPRQTKRTTNLSRATFIGQLGTGTCSNT